MHHAHLLAGPLGLGGGLDGQAALQHADHAGRGDTGGDGVAEFPQLVGNDLRGACLAVTKLWILVEVAPLHDDLRVQLHQQPRGLGS